MIDLAAMLGAIQDGGGLLLLLAGIVFELRSIRRDFGLHEKLYKHEPKAID